uniref:Uncharacterized protein n=1 Tax=Glossina pallidipes TaxID=7398 RepID=A0A1A9ZKH3_GLOPL
MISFRELIEPNVKAAKPQIAITIFFQTIQLYEPKPVSQWAVSMTRLSASLSSASNEYFIILRFSAIYITAMRTDKGSKYSSENAHYNTRIHKSYRHRQNAGAHLGRSLPSSSSSSSSSLLLYLIKTYLLLPPKPSPVSFDLLVLNAFHHK